MKNSTVLILAAAAAFVLLRKPATATPATAATVTSTGPRSSYFNPAAVASQFANSVLASWGDVARRQLPGAAVNTGPSPAAGLSSLVWTNGQAPIAVDPLNSGYLGLSGPDAWTIAGGGPSFVTAADVSFLQGLGA